MKHSVGKILAITFLLVLALGCARTGRVIPEEKFSDIYAEMLIADQWISSNLKARRVADTTLFYAPILEKYGYDVLDYDASVRHYMKKPADFAAILDKSSSKLTAYANRLQAVEDEMKSRYKLPPYKSVDFGKDTILVIQLDTVSLTEPAADSTLVPPADSVLVLQAIDSTGNKIQIDTTHYERKGNTEEMLLLHGPDDTASRRHSVKRPKLGPKSNQIAL